MQLLKKYNFKSSSINNRFEEKYKTYRNDELYILCAFKMSSFENPL